jgi:hypothetical protein
MSQFELLSDALLVSLVAILVFILYKRLLHMMGRQNVQAKYPALDTETVFEEEQVFIRLLLMQPMYLKVSVLDETRNVLEVIQDGHSEKGEHAFVFNTVGRPVGKYAFEIVTPNEKSLRYFHIA